MVKKFQIWFARSNGGMRLEILLIPYSMKDHNIYFVTMHRNGYRWCDATFKKTIMSRKLDRLLATGRIPHVEVNLDSTCYDESRAALAAKEAYKHIHRKTRNAVYGECQGWSTLSKMRNLYFSVVKYRKLYAWCLFA